MSVREEARQEAERRWPEAESWRMGVNAEREWRRRAFIDGASWASEQADREKVVCDHGCTAVTGLCLVDHKPTTASEQADREPSDAETIEHVARAIQAAHKPKDTEVPAWKDESEEWRETYRDFARAALLAAQEVRHG